MEQTQKQGKSSAVVPDPRNDVFRGLEQHSEERRRKLLEAQMASANDNSAPAVYDDDDSDNEAAPVENGTAGEEKKSKPKKPKKPKITVAEAASKIDPSDLVAFLADICFSFELRIPMDTSLRLLAGMKRQNSDMNLLIPSSFKCVGSEFEARMNSLLKSYLSNPYLSNEEIVEASRLAAKEASKVAQAARATAEEKAVKAAKAVAAAKSALELVAIVNEETYSQEKYLKRNKMKKHVAIQSLYGGERNGKTVEELARNLHRVINSSPRILKGTSTSESDYPKNKKLKVSSSFKKTSVCNVGTASEGNQTSTRNGILDDENSDDRVTEKNMEVVDLNKNGRMEMEYGDKSRFSNYNLSSTGKREGETALMKQQVSKDVDCGNDKKKYKTKQKKLPLSICNVRDLETPKKDLKDKCSSSTDDDISKYATSSESLVSVGPSGENIMQNESGLVWKCKAFKVPACVKLNKVLQS